MRVAAKILWAADQPCDGESARIAHEIALEFAPCARAEYISGDGNWGLRVVRSMAAKATVDPVSSGIDIEVTILIGNPEHWISANLMGGVVGLIPSMPSYESLTAGAMRFMLSVPVIGCYGTAELEALRELARDREEPVMVRLGDSLVTLQGVIDLVTLLPSSPVGSPVALYVGDLCYEDGLDQLIANWCALQDRPRTKHRTLILAGTGTYEVPQRPDIVLAPHSTDVIRELFALADVVVIPYWNRGAGPVLSDAKRWGTPIVVNAKNHLAAREVGSVLEGSVYGTTEEFVRAISTHTSEDGRTRSDARELPSIAGPRKSAVQEGESALTVAIARVVRRLHD